MLLVYKLKMLGVASFVASINSIKLLCRIHIILMTKILSDLVLNDWCVFNVFIGK